MNMKKWVFCIVLSLLSQWVGAQTNDTLRVRGYLFVSQPIPEEVKDRMRGVSMPENAAIGFDELRYLTVFHYNYEGKIRKGELVCHRTIAHDLLCVFKELFAGAYPIHSIRLVDDFGGSDEASMRANNTSCFNYRNIAGTRMLSKHAQGLAVDVNPLENPSVRGERIRPQTAADYVDRSRDFPHKIDENDLCKRVFESHGFQWGGRWISGQDYHHFEKRQ